MTPGHCFIGLVNGSDDVEEPDDAVLWFYINLIWFLLNQMVHALVIWLGGSERCSPTEPRAKFLLIILFQHILTAFFFVWDLYWTIKLMLTNRSLLVGNEYIFGFGQVGALVALIIPLCTFYTGAWRIIYWDDQMLTITVNQPGDGEQGKKP